MTTALILKNTEKKFILFKNYISRREMKVTHKILLKELQCKDMKYSIY